MNRMCADLFRSENLVVRYIGGFSRDRLVITFFPYNEAHQPDIAGFGEEFFRKRLVDAVHFIPRENDWYLQPEMPAAVEIVRDAACTYRKVVTYGSSMGGYAAIRLGNAVGAKEAIAISPQFSIDPEVAPFEHRWSADAARIDFGLERSWTSPFVERSYVVYDPYDLDRQHVELFRPRTELVDVRILNGGHPAIWLLADLGLLERLVFDVLEGRLQPTVFQCAVRARRRESARFFSVLAQKSRNPARRMALARRAHEMAPEEVSFLVGYGSGLAALGRFPEARAVFGRALTMAPESPYVLYHLSFVHEWAGDFESAADAMHRLVGQHPSFPAAHKVRTEFLAQRLAAEAGWREDIRKRAASGYPRRIALGYPRPAVRNWRKGVNRKQLAEGIIAKLPLSIARRLVWPDRGRAGTGGVTAAAVPPLPGAQASRLGTLLCRPARGRVDLLLIGDGFAQHWDRAFWHPLNVVNLGVSGSGTQHVLRCLRQVRARIDAGCALVTVGRADLAAGAPPEQIAAAVDAIVDELALVSPSTPCLVIEIPRGGACPGREADRQQLNELLRRAPLFATIDIDAVSDLIKSDGEEGDDTLDDACRLSDQGYRILTRAILSRIDHALPRPR
jgi:hypothetical protein